jgi:hypothetical protein
MTGEPVVLRLFAYLTNLHEKARRTMEMDPMPSTCDTDTRTPPVDPSMRSISDRFWTSLRSEAFRCIRATIEREVLAVAWGPRIDVTFDPKKAPNLLGGTLRLMGRTTGTEVELASAPIIAVDKPITLSAATGCDEYVVKVAAGTNAATNDPMVDSYFYARVYSTTR